MSPMLRTLLAIVPLAVFWWVESSYGMQAGIIAALVIAGFDVGITWWIERRLSKLVLFTTLLVAVLGGLSLLGDDPWFFLMGPAIGDVVFAGVMVGTGMVGTGVMVTAMKEQQPDLDLHPLEAAFFRQVELRFAANLLLHALLVAWSVQQSREIWLLVSGPVQYGMMGVQILAEIGWGRLVVGPRVDAAIAKEDHGTT